MIVSNAGQSEMTARRFFSAGDGRDREKTAAALAITVVIGYNSTDFYR